MIGTGQRSARGLMVVAMLCWIALIAINGRQQHRASTTIAAAQREQKRHADEVTRLLAQERSRSQGPDGRSLALADSQAVLREMNAGLVAAGASLAAMRGAYRPIATAAQHVAAIAALASIYLQIWFSWRANRRRRAGQCVPCGYSLVGNASGVCPECGTPVGRTPNRHFGQPR